MLSHAKGVKQKNSPLACAPVLSLFFVSGGLYPFVCKGSGRNLRNLRNPFHVKFFLSVGDWCGKMWMEELKGGHRAGTSVGRSLRGKSGHEEPAWHERGLGSEDV